jgi:ribonuclease-3
MDLKRQTEEIEASDLREVMERALEQSLGHTFRDRDLLLLAFTHRSYSNERGDDSAGADYERLEFLGDSVLGLVTCQWLYERYPDQPEGELSRRKSFLVSAPVLSHHGKELGVGPLLRLGIGEERSGGRFKASILADVVEALFGAVYLDGGMEAAQRAIRLLLVRAADEGQDANEADAKTVLQERLQASGRPLPSYHLVAAEGPDHAKTFTVECRVEGSRAGIAHGRSKKVAEQGAASAALEALDLMAAGS